MKTKRKTQPVAKQASSNQTVLDATHHASPKPDKVMKSCSKGEDASPSRLPLIRKSPLAKLPEKLALQYLARPSTVEAQVGIDPWKVRDFACDLIRRRVFCFRAECGSSKDTAAIDTLWSIKLGTGIVLFQDTENNFYAGKLCALKSKAIETLILEMDAQYCLLPFEDEEEVLVDRNIVSEDGLASALAEYYYGTPIQKQGACRAVMQHCIRWVDYVSLHPGARIAAPIPRIPKDKK